jgi:hypothetical protein
MLAGLLIALITGLGLILYWYQKTSKARKMIDKIPGPEYIPILGNALDMEREGHGNYQIINIE